jgi:type IV pilus assembly protein PilX
MMPTHNFSTTRSRQSGAVLIVSLLFLVILTILGITAMQGTTLEHRMAGNTRDHAIAMQAAEAALRDAHRDVNPNPALNELGRNLPPTSYGGGTAGTCVAGLCLANPQIEGASGYVLPPTPAAVALEQQFAIYGAHTQDPPQSQPLKGTVAGVGNQPLPVQPRYWVEAMCGIEPPGETVSSGVTCGFRRITARGYGINPNTRVTLQEIYRIAVF